MNREELVNSIDATYLKVDFSKNKCDSIVHKIKAYKFKYFCSWPRIAVNWGFYASEDLMIDFDTIGVFNFPTGICCVDRVMDDILEFKHNLNEFDIVVPDINAVNNFMKAFQQKVRLVCYDKIIKFIIEQHLHNSDDLQYVCEKSIEVKADYIKTHTGFSSRGVTVDDVKRIKDVVGDKIKIKAAGGIKTLAQLLELRDAGASRFGISIDNACKIVDEFDKKNKGE